MVSLYQIAYLFFVGFALNIFWEFSHSQLYETCRRETWRVNARLLTFMSFKDALLIVVFYLISSSIFHVQNILLNPWAVAFFGALGLGFAFLDERISIRRKRWAYASSMPTVFGVGITPLFEIAITGIASLYFVFAFLPQ